MKTIRHIYIPRDSLIFTGHGLEKLSKISATSNLPQELGAELPLMQITPSVLLPKETLECVQIATDSLNRLELPLETIVCTRRGRVAVCDLREDDEIEHFLCDPTIPREHKKSKIEEQWSTHYTMVGRILGALIATGTFRYQTKKRRDGTHGFQMVLQAGHVGLSSDDPIFRDDNQYHPLAVEFEKYFGQGTLRNHYASRPDPKDKTKTLYRSKITHLTIPKHFFGIIFHNKEEILEWMLDQPMDTIKGFLRVLFTCDATINNRRMRLPCVQLEKAQIIKILLTRVGVYSHIKKNITTKCKNGESRDSYFLVIDSDDLIFRFPQFVGIDREYDYRKKWETIEEFRSARGKRNKMVEPPFSKITSIKRAWLECERITILGNSEVCKLGIDSFKCYF